MLHVLEKLNENRGLPEETWDTLASQVQDLKHRAPPEDAAKIAKHALEAGYYKLAHVLGLTNPFEAGYAALMSHDRQAFDLLFKSICQRILVPADSTLLMQLILTKSVLAMIRSRIDGSFKEAANIFEMEIAPVLKTHHATSAKEIEPEFRADVLLLSGSAYFNFSDYAKAYSLYSDAYRSFENLRILSKSAVASFNMAVAAEYLGLNSEMDGSLARADEILKTISVPGLRKSIDLFIIQRAVSTFEFERAIHLGRAFLKRHALSDVQKVLACQALARALIETGRVTDAEVVLAQARSLIQTKHFFQYETFQIALETEIENLVYRRVARSPLLNNPRRAEDRRALALFSVAQARKCHISGDRTKTKKLIRQIADLPETIKETLYTKDIELDLHFEQRAPEAMARGLLSQVIAAARMKNRGFLVLCVSHFEREADLLNPWSLAAVKLAQAFLGILNESASEALKFSEETLSIAEAHGLERLFSLALAVTAYCDSHRQILWINHVNGLPEAERAPLLATISEILGEQFASPLWMVSAHEKRLTPHADRFEGELLINQARGVAIYNGSPLPLGRGILFNMLVQLAFAQKTGVSKSKLIQSVWGSKYDPFQHDPVIYANIARLRDFLPVECHDGLYRLPTDLSWTLIADTEASAATQLDDKSSGVMSLLKVQGLEAVSRREVVKQLNVSPRTALRILNQLAEKKILSRKGRGRSAVYVLTRRGAVS